MATKAKEKIIYSEIESTIHVKDGEEETLADGTKYQPHASRVLLPGQMITLDEVPDYMIELVKENKAPGLVLLDIDEANKLNEFAKLVRGEAKITDFINQSKSEDLDLDLETP